MTPRILILMVVMVASALTALPAKADWNGYRDHHRYAWSEREAREREWREHERRQLAWRERHWREHEWRERARLQALREQAWRQHEWRERHRW